MSSTRLLQSDHFQLVEVDEGAYAALVAADGLAIGNAGIIDLGDQTLVFDTFENPVCAEDLRRAAETLTGRPATYIVNSHAHADHWYGNQVFAPTTPIIGTTKTVEGMLDYVEEVQQVQADPSEFEDWLRELAGQLDAETDPLIRQQLNTSLRRAEANLAALATLELRLPNLLFEERLRLGGGKRQVVLETWGGGHTDSDVMLFLPEAKIVFTADIGFFHRQPYMGSAHPDRWVEQLERLLASEYDTFVPGHGPVGTREEVQLQLDYFRWLQEALGQALQEGESPEAFGARAMPPPFTEWSLSGLPSEVNVRKMYTYLGRK